MFLAGTDWCLWWREKTRWEGIVIFGGIYFLAWQGTWWFSEGIISWREGWKGRQRASSPDTSRFSFSYHTRTLRDSAQVGLKSFRPPSTLGTGGTQLFQTPDSLGTKHVGVDGTLAPWRTDSRQGTPYSKTSTISLKTFWRVKTRPSTDIDWDWVLQNNYEYTGESFTEFWEQVPVLRCPLKAW